MYVNALIKRAGIFAGRQSLNKCNVCLEKAAAIAPDSIDILVHRARVSLTAHVYMYPCTTLAIMTLSIYVHVHCICMSEKYLHPVSADVSHTYICMGEKNCLYKPVVR